jgi:hypothetical protein
MKIWMIIGRMSSMMTESVIRDPVRRLYYRTGHGRDTHVRGVRRYSNG